MQKDSIHEIEPEAFDNVVKESVVLEAPKRLREAINHGIETAATPLYGPVRLGIPNEFLADTIDSPPTTTTPEWTPYDITNALEAAESLLAQVNRPLLYVGGEPGDPRMDPPGVMAFADTLEVPVLTSFKGQEVFPKDDDRSLCVTGKDLPAGGKHVLSVADNVLALGTDFDG